MSDYHYYKLKEDSKYKDFTIEDCNNKLDGMRDTAEMDTVIFLADMINAYYEDNLNQNYSKIKWGIASLTYNAKQNNDFHYLKEILEDSGHRLVRNHPHSEWEMESDVEDYEENVNRIIKNLMLLATIRFVPDERYSDTPKTIMEYLSGEYINKIEEELDYLNELTEEYTLAKFILENCIEDNENEDE